MFISLNAGGYSAHTDTAECSLADVGIWVQLKQALWIGSRGPKDTEMARWIPCCKRWSHLETKRLHGRKDSPAVKPSCSLREERDTVSHSLQGSHGGLPWERKEDCISQISFELCPSETSQKRNPLNPERAGVGRTAQENWIAISKDVSMFCCLPNGPETHKLQFAYFM